MPEREGEIVLPLIRGLDSNFGHEENLVVWIGYAVCDLN